MRQGRRAPVSGPHAGTVLVVDDSRAQRQLICASLRKWGYNALEAGSGAEALALFQQHGADLILSDWMMPGMTGIELCRAIRGLGRQEYVYFILFTARADKAAVAEGLEVGADDFLSKPVDPGELRARIKAGERLLQMERELRAKNVLLTETLVELRGLYDSLDRDLIEARALQQSLLRERQRQYPTGRINMLLRPSGHIGGDMVGCFDIDDRHIGLYGFDVSGHGVASALLTARLAGLLSGASAEQNIAIGIGDDGPRPRPPAQVAEVMNRLLLSEIQTERYATLCYAHIDRLNGSVRMVQAGHPYPVVQHGDGRVTHLGQGGLPIGLLADACYDDFQAQLRPGDRLFMISDGITECPNAQGEELGQMGLQMILSRLAGLRGPAMMEALIWELARWAGHDDFTDDISCAVFEFDG
ncbi:MAG: SpoIIE family protein phosphatase [Pararhodobacter sp.]|nr:SpoIIE family protein phosphatase [Pararhodobacter sp.]